MCVFAMSLMCLKYKSEFYISTFFDEKLFLQQILQTLQLIIGVLNH